MSVFLFLLGLAVGSFLNVVALRYDPDRFIFGKHLGGRSFCPHCKNKLVWYELVPFLSYLALRGRCRTCRAPLNIQYPIVELLSGVIFVFVPLSLSPLRVLTSGALTPLSILWILVFLTLLLISVIDIRLRIIPDELNVLLVVLGVAALLAVSFLPGPSTPNPTHSFVGSYALMFGLQGNVWVNHFLAALLAGAFFGALTLLTHGRGMGMGDVKLAAALGIVFGWPDIALIAALSFVVGALFGIGGMVFSKMGRKSTVPFGPFLAAGAALTFFFGYEILHGYFGLFGVF